ncbi:deazaflavin-dependent oxidoreductase, nitroreductase family [Amycolatopsis xylanica]|uniref:Deazaflavin-dependent oxidoreductase, nitroreductase family n=1 Tax=Amycolatopsis xylanica TaxID=589385 RepID=A0A1H3AAG7_9PSEU|nr:nitroreductase family deazaflavin-dependent oxidoreductase [Amycolatopsis xylanica]SDX26633.1 deazaflavin-dependent oxidoreductase, nitroreductase family [Amycolatopsis xylanica]
MVLPKRLARFNRVATNKIARHIAGWLPWMGLVEHQGRKSGRTYRTPVNVFRAEDGFVLALTYGPDTDWVKNVLVNGGGQLITRRKTYAVSEPRLVRDESRGAMPFGVRQILKAVDVADFMYLKARRH